ncbi:MAG TPA: ABC transporter ATP-binding protein [Chloroflexota bacterium]|jgi:branched-chain amino acid transport system ATP-binding protein|nr:ABC transporter ATP-binding protein [Chloroflexota bacterium]
MSEPEPLLDARDLVVRYGPVEALHGVSVQVFPGEVVALIGSNGAGKTTLLRAISGMIAIAGGSVTFGGQSITNLRSHEIVRRGLAHIPEGRQIFGDQSVYDNLLLGGFSQDANVSRELADAELRRFPVLLERRKQKAGTLSGGEQQMLAISRGLMSKPRMLLMDEPSMGLAPLLVRQVAQTILDLNAQGVTVLLVEQMASMALAVADRAYVIQNGQVKLSGPSREVASNPEVVRAYLGGAAGVG